MTRKTEKIRWGVMGCAEIARGQFLPAFLTAKGVELKAVASRNVPKAEEFARAFGAAKAYGSYEELLSDPDIDAVYIPLPNHLHREWTVKAAQAGKHVLCEKPLALDETECDEMIGACRENGVFLMEAFMYRFHPQMKRVKEIVDKGEIGEVKLINASFTYPIKRGENVRLVPEYGGGAVMDVGCYPISFSRFIFGGEPVKVDARANFSGGVDFTLVSTLDFGGGRYACFDCSFEMANRQAAEIVGTKGTIEIAAPWRPDNNAVAVRVTTEAGSREEKFEPANPYRLEIEHFSECIRSDRKPMIPGEHGKKNVAVIRACLEAAGNG